ncbi:MAG: F0F1 ATP synthase subunit B [Thermoflexales bacterium]|nr:F0F1 ATP synthase subunit B [Thermoflexales bacterium]
MNALAYVTPFAEGGGDVFGNLGINGVMLLAQIINLIFLILFLKPLLIEPLLKNLEARRKRIDDSLENARKADERLANVEKDYQAKLEEARAEAQKARTEALTLAQADADRVRADAHVEAEKIKVQARSDASAERTQMLAGVRSQVAALAIAAANKVVGDNLDAKRQSALIDDFFAKVPAGLVAGAAAGAGSASVTSALPLSDSEKAAVKADLARQMSGLADVKFDVDPAILGGLVVRVGDKVIDGSVQGKMSALRQQLGQ